jgi:hypothetical protein
MVNVDTAAVDDVGAAEELGVDVDVVASEIGVDAVVGSTLPEVGALFSPPLEHPARTRPTASNETRRRRIRSL